MITLFSYAILPRAYKFRFVRQRTSNVINPTVLYMRPQNEDTNANTSQNIVVSSSNLTSPLMLRHSQDMNFNYDNKISSLLRISSQRSLSVVNGSMAGDIGFDPLGKRIVKN